MRPELIAQLFTLAVLLTTLYFQIKNYIKYRLTNGANTIRLTLTLTNVLFIVHTLRMIFDESQGYFFMAGVICLLFLYTRDWIRDKLKI